VSRASAKRNPVNDGVPGNRTLAVLAALAGLLSLLVTLLAWARLALVVLIGHCLSPWSSEWRLELPTNMPQRGAYQ
jgi:hypothetical protein